MNMKKLCIIFGGASVEHDVSIITGLQLCKNLEKTNEIEKIYIGVDNKFYNATKLNQPSQFENKNDLKLKEVVFSSGSLYQKGMFYKKICDIDCVINCCHGGVGENGDLAGFFATLGIRCTSSNALAAHIAMDKSLTKTLIEKVVPVVKGIKVNKNNYKTAIEDIKNNLKDELIVKPNSLGSSIGVKVCDKTNFISQIDAIFEMCDDALVEEKVNNLKEYNQACFMDNNELVLSAIESPISKCDFLSFDDKYKSGGKSKGKDRELPAKISKTLSNKITEYTKRVYSILNVNGVVRIDYLYDTKSKKLYFNEINTIPGSMAFYLYEPIGIDYISLIHKLVENAGDIKKFAYYNTQILKDKKI